jgi:hypothetical protein
LTGVYGASIQGFSSPSMLFFAQGNKLPFALLGTASAAGFSVQSFLLVSRGTWAPQDEPGWVYNSFEYPTGPAYPNTVVGHQVQVSHHPEVPLLAGTITRSSGTWPFSGGAVQFSNYNFATPMPVSEVVGHWDLLDLAGNPVVIDIDDQGSVEGSYQTCALTGSAMPASSRKGYLTLSVSLDASTCPSRPGTAPRAYQGFVLAYALSGGLRQMVLYGLAQWEGPHFPEADSILAIGAR